MLPCLFQWRLGWVAHISKRSDASLNFKSQRSHKNLANGGCFWRIGKCMAWWAQEHGVLHQTNQPEWWSGKLATRMRIHVTRVTSQITLWLRIQETWFSQDYLIVNQSQGGMEWYLFFNALSCALIWPVEQHRKLTEEYKCNGLMRIFLTKAHESGDTIWIGTIMGMLL